MPPLGGLSFFVNIAFAAYIPSAINTSAITRVNISLFKIITNYIFCTPLLFISGKYLHKIIGFAL